MRVPSIKILVVYDVQVKSPDVSQVPLIINYGMFLVLVPRSRAIGSHHVSLDLPKAVEEYAHRFVQPTFVDVKI